jgi:hypothetical protein
MKIFRRKLDVFIEVYTPSIKIDYNEIYYPFCVYKLK